MKVIVDIKFKDKHLTSGTKADYRCDTLKNLLRRSTRVTIDLSNIKSITPEYADRLFYFSLSNDVNKKLLKRLKFSGGNDEVNNCIQQSINDSLRAGDRK